MINQLFHARTWVVVAFVAMAVFSVHHSRADAPPGRYIIANGTVFDTKTNLMWQQGHQGNTLNWSDAKSYCDGLTLYGMSDWRLPNVKELQSIVDERKANPAIDTAYFPNTPPDWFWTSSPLADSSSAAWVVYFYDGSTYSDEVANAYRVRCVR